MQNKRIKEMVTAGLLITLGLVLPGVFHSLGLGSVFLPMHIPALLGGLMLSLPYAVAVGALTPFLSSMITGMPPAFPVMPYMVFELAAYGAAACILSRKLRLNVYIALIGSMISGRLVAGIAVWVLAAGFGAKLPGPVAFIASAATTGIPGMIIQILFIPAVLLLLKKSGIIGKEGFEIG